VAIYFFDSSGIVKRYVVEVGSSWVKAITDPDAGHRIHIAQIAAVEVAAAVARRVFTGDTSRADADVAIAHFRHDYVNQYNPLEITEQVIDSAMALAESHTLRAYDAVQLAVAVELNARVNAQNVALGIPVPAAPVLTLISSDIALNDAAATEGLIVDNPNNHP
jgi:predicted nucleic acid-binding protein